MTSPHITRRLISVVLCLILGFALAIALPQTPISAQGNRVEVNACNGTDVILVVDQSGSMTNQDGNRRRFDAAQSIIDTLYLNAAIDCENIVTHRVAAIGFNDSSFEIFGFTDIFVPNASDPTWEQAASLLKRRLLENAGSVEGQTRVALALINTGTDLTSINAENLFAGLNPLSDSQSRKRVVVLITDGPPCNNNAANSACGSPDWVEHYFTDNHQTYNSNEEQAGFDTAIGLRSSIQGALPNVQINVLLFNSDSTGGIFRVANEQWTAVAEGSGGKFFGPSAIAQLSDITGNVQRIFSELLNLNQKTLACEQAFYLEPYQSGTSIISSVRPNTSSNIRIIDPDGNVIGQSDRGIQYTSLDTIERYILTGPKPGAYTITGDPILCNSIQANLQTSAVDAELLPLPSPDQVVVNLDSPYYQPDSRARIRIQLTDKRFKQAFNEAPLSPLNLCARVVSVESGAAILSECITFTAQGNGLWESIQPVPAPKQGRYRINLRATVQSINPSTPNQEVLIFELPNVDESDVARYEYQTAPPVSVTGTAVIIDAPNVEGKIIAPLNRVEADGAQTANPIIVGVSFATDRNAVPIIHLLPNSATRGEAFIAEITGNGITEAIDLVEDPNDGNRLIGRLRDNLSSLDPQGSYIITVRPTPEGLSAYNRDNYVLNEQSLDLTIERYELSGVKLINNSIPASILLNTINVDDLTRVNNPIAVSVKLVSQDNTDLKAIEVFGVNQGVNVVVATLSLNGTAVEITSLTLNPSTDNVYEGVLRAAVNGLDAAGTYTVTISFGTDANIDPQRLSDYQLLRSSTVTQNIERLPQFGLLIRDESRLSGTTQDLNRIEKNTQVPNEIRLISTLTSLDGQPYTYEEIVGEVFPSGVDTSKIIEALIEGPQGPQKRWLDLGLDGQFSTQFTSLYGDGLDPAGKYSVRYQLNPELMSDNPLVKYLHIPQDTEVSYDLLEVEGITLKLSSLAFTNVETRDLNAQALQVSLYQTQEEAMGNLLLWDDHSTSPVQFQLLLRDTENTAIDLLKLLDTNIIRKGQTSADPLTTEEVSINDLITVNVTPINLPEGVAVETVNVSDLSLVTRDNATIIVGTIDDQATATGEYRLCYRFNDGFLRLNARNLSTTPNCLDFSRGITDGWRDPQTWNFVAIVLDIAILVFVLNFLRINFLFPIKGSVTRTWTRDIDPNDMEKKNGRLRGWKIFRNQKVFKDTFILSNNRGKVNTKTTVWRAFFSFGTHQRLLMNWRYEIVSPGKKNDVTRSNTLEAAQGATSDQKFKVKIDVPTSIDANSTNSKQNSKLPDRS